MIRRCLLGALVVSAVVAAAAAPPARARADIFDQPMVFVLAENKQHDLQWIAAIGTITTGTPAAFEEFAQAIKRKNMWIVFSSPGGNVVASLDLGEMIRQRGYNTDVAFTILRGNGKDSLTPGYCLSACGYAFLGGVKRDLQEGSVLGYHQFFFDDPEAMLDKKTGDEAAKVLTHYIALYLQRMGIAARLLDLASATKPTDYYEPSSHERFEMHIVTKGVEAVEEETDKNDSEKTPQTALGKRSEVVLPEITSDSAVRCVRRLPTAGDEKVPDLSHHLVEHLLREDAGLRVVTGAVIAVENYRAGGNDMPRAVTELEGGCPLSQRDHDRVMGDTSESQDGVQVAHSRDFAG